MKITSEKLEKFCWAIAQHVGAKRRDGVFPIAINSMGERYFISAEEGVQAPTEEDGELISNEFGGHVLMSSDPEDYFFDFSLVCVSASGNSMAVIHRCGKDWWITTSGTYSAILCRV